MNRFTLPRDLYFGKGAAAFLEQVKTKKAMLVYGSNRMEKDGSIAKLKGYLEKAGAKVECITGVEEDPSVATVMAGAAKMREFEPDLIVGVGGGSPIDAAKAMWVFYEHPDLSFEDAAKPFELPALRNKAKFIAIATTSGTATEVTSFSVVADEKTGIKYPLADYNLTPDVAILDMDFVQSMPKTLIANTGLDALTHAIEAYVSTVANPITDALAMKAIEMIVKDLKASWDGDLNAREQMHIAQSLAGMSFSNAILGITHSMAHKSGKIFSVAHGLANAIYLPRVIEFNAKEAPHKYVDIAKRLHLAGSCDEELIASLVSLVEELKSSMNMPKTLKDYGVKEEDFKAKVDALASTSVSDPCTGTNPRKINDEQMRKLYEAVFYGFKVDF